MGIFTRKMGNEPCLRIILLLHTPACPRGLVHEKPAGERREGPQSLAPQQTPLQSSETRATGDRAGCGGGEPSRTDPGAPTSRPRPAGLEQDWADGVHFPRTRTEGWDALSRRTFQIRAAGQGLESSKPESQVFFANTVFHVGSSYLVDPNCICEELGSPPSSDLCLGKRP